MALLPLTPKEDSSALAGPGSLQIVVGLGLQYRTASTAICLPSQGICVSGHTTLGLASGADEPERGNMTGHFQRGMAANTNTLSRKVPLHHYHHMVFS